MSETKRLTIRLIPPDFPESAPRYQVWDVEHERDAGVINYQPYHTSRGPHWKWQITVIQLPGHRHTASGETPTLEEAKAAFRAAWDTFPAHPNWPPAQSRARRNEPSRY